MHDMGYEHRFIHKTLFTQIIISIKHFYFRARSVRPMKRDTFFFFFFCSVFFNLNKLGPPKILIKIIQEENHVLGDGCVSGVFNRRLIVSGCHFKPDLAQQGKPLKV